MKAKLIVVRVWEGVGRADAKMGGGGGGHGLFCSEKGGLT